LTSAPFIAMETVCCWTNSYWIIGRTWWQL